MPADNDNLSRLEQFLANSETQTKDEAIEELASRGVNMNAFKARVAETVRKGYQLQVKLAAQAVRHGASQKGSRRFGDLIGKPLSELKAIFERIRAGEFGVGCQQAALARCRNLQSDDPSESELRSWLEDISTLEEP